MNHVQSVIRRVAWLFFVFADLSRVLWMKDGLLVNLVAAKVEVDVGGGGFGDMGERDLVVNGRFGQIAQQEMGECLLLTVEDKGGDKASIEAIAGDDALTALDYDWRVVELGE